MIAQFKMVDLLLPLGILMITMSMMMQIRKRRRRASFRHDFDRKSIMDQQAVGRGARGDIEDLMVEVQEMASQLSAQLDCKSAMLEKRIQDADQRIERLNHLSEELKRIEESKE